MKQLVRKLSCCCSELAIYTVLLLQCFDKVLGIQLNTSKSVHGSCPKHVDYSAVPVL